MPGVGAGKLGGDLRAFVLHLEPALLEGRLGLHVGVPAGAVDRRDADAVAAQARVAAAPMPGKFGQHAVAVGLQRVDAQVERRARGKRLPPPRPSRRRRLPRSSGAHQSGTVGARSASGASSSRRVDGRAQLVLGSAAAARTGRRRAPRSAPPASRSIRAAARRSRARAACRRRAASRPNVCGAARHRRCCRSRRGRRRRRSGATGPSPSAHRPPAGAAARCLRELRWLPPAVRQVACR